MLAKAGDYLCTNGELVGCEPESFASGLMRETVEFEDDIPRFDHCNVVLHRSLSRSHRHLGSFFRNRLVGENTDPDLSSALETPCHGATCCLELARRDFRGIESFESHRSESKLRTARCLAAE